MSTSQTAALKESLMKKCLQAQDFSHGCPVRHLGSPRNLGFLQAARHQVLFLFAQEPTRTGQPLDPIQQMLFGSPGHTMSLTGTLGCLSAWQEQVAL
jgi:hypothetical protein